MRGSRKFFRGGAALTTFFFFFFNSFVSFLFDEGRKDPDTTISGPSWGFAGGQIMTRH